MAIHICRDFLTLPIVQHSGSMYFVSCFAIGVLGFSQVGQTNFNISGSSIVSSGIDASILTVSGTTSVTIPSASYSVSVSDVNRILALRSDVNPRYNSGLFRVESIDTLNNQLNIAYRATEDSIPETETLTWTVFQNEQNMPGFSNATARTPIGGLGYQSTGPTYNGPRIILESPHSSSWQFRMCQESTTDYDSFGVRTSIAPGFSGSALGDFVSGSFDMSLPQPEHTHGPAWFNTTQTRYRGTVVGMNANWNSENSNTTTRYYMWGDDDKGTIVVLIRNVANYNDFWFSFGLSEDDVQAPELISQKLFAAGMSAGGAATTGDIQWDFRNGASNSFGFSGVGFGLTKKPENITLAQFSYVGHMHLSPYDNTNAVDNNILQSTELHTVDIYGGMTDSPYNPENYPTYLCIQYAPRKLGAFPIARIGRTNFANWTLTTDTSKSWLHAKNGVYLPWEGPSIL